MRRLRKATNNNKATAAATGSNQNNTAGATTTTKKKDDDESKMERDEEKLLNDREATNHNFEVTDSDGVIPSSTSSFEHQPHPPPGVAAATKQQQQPINAKEEEDDDACTPESDLADLTKCVTVVTTAGLPWRTGTAVNPLARALFLTRGRPDGAVTLLIPWLPDAAARRALYGVELENPSDQEEWVRDYCRTRAQCSDEERKLRIRFWKGAYHSGFGSIFPTQDICSLVSREEADVVILEEPEHLNWFRVPSAALSERNDSGSSAGGRKEQDAGQSDAVDDGGGGKPKPNEDLAKWNELGWSHKFPHVVGILHTNYGAYIRQYGMGTSLVTAPALNALSALVIRAYCHRVIRLSKTLPSFEPAMEVTRNVHGVRTEFFPDPSVAPSNKDAQKIDNENARVYFIGKLIWAKGFDKVLEVQERFRAATGAYFAMDCYGGGDDVKAIKRAFFGRHKPAKTAAANSDDTGHASDSAPSSAQNSRANSPNSSDDTSDEGSKLSSNVFGRRESLREQLEDSAQDSSPYCNVEEVVAPLDILGDLSGKALNSGAETAASVAHLLEHGIGTFVGRATHSLPRPGISLIPSRSRYKWRREPIPARFLGVKDHIEVRDMPEQCVFLNMSITEVLCTTSAEALAMGKWVILPKHASNEFFYDFENCLEYSTLDECVEKLQYALNNAPHPLSASDRRILSWEGATERLIEASRITRKEWQERIDSKKDREYERAARFHVDSSRRSHFVADLFSGRALRNISSSASQTNEE